MTTKQLSSSDYLYTGDVIRFKVKWYSWDLGKDFDFDPKQAIDKFFAAWSTHAAKNPSSAAAKIELKDVKLSVGGGQGKPIYPVFNVEALVVDNPIPVFALATAVVLIGGAIFAVAFKPVMEDLVKVVQGYPQEVVKDAKGNPVFDSSGKPVLTNTGNTGGTFGFVLAIAAIGAAIYYFGKH